MAATWTDFAGLCAAHPEIKPSRFRRMIKARQITSRQRVQGGKREFFLPTIARELAAQERRSVVRESEPSGLQEVIRMISELRNEVRELRAKSGTQTAA